MIERKIAAIELNNNSALDIADLTNSDWREVDRRAKIIMGEGMANNEKVAFVAGFLVYIGEKQAMNEPFGEQH